jgi:hypothetical protein
MIEGQRDPDAPGEQKGEPEEKWQGILMVHDFDIFQQKTNRYDQYFR